MLTKTSRDPGTWSLESRPHSFNGLVKGTRDILANHTACELATNLCNGGEFPTPMRAVAAVARKLVAAPAGGRLLMRRCRLHTAQSSQTHWVKQRTQTANNSGAAPLVRGKMHDWMGKFSSRARALLHVLVALLAHSARDSPSSPERPRPRACQICELSPITLQSLPVQRSRQDDFKL